MSLDELYDRVDSMDKDKDLGLKLLNAGLVRTPIQKMNELKYFKEKILCKFYELSAEFITLNLVLCDII